jgi:hypothetical protein
MNGFLQKAWLVSIAVGDHLAGTKRQRSAVADYGERGFPRHRHVVQFPQSILQYVQSRDELSASLMRPLAESLGEKLYRVTQLFGFDANPVSTCRVKGPQVLGSPVKLVSKAFQGMSCQDCSTVITQSRLNSGVTSPQRCCRYAFSAIQ